MKNLADYARQHPDRIAMTLLFLIALYAIYSCNNQNEYMKASEPKLELILYYHPKCGHCKAFMPTWYRVEDYFRRSIINTKSINCSENPQQCNYLITGYPTIIMYNKGKPFVFDRDRTLENVIGFASSMS